MAHLILSLAMFFVARVQLARAGAPDLWWPQRGPDGEAAAWDDLSSRARAGNGHADRIEIIVRSVGGTASGDESEECSVARRQERGSSAGDTGETSALPSAGLALVICPLHEALLYANSLPLTTEVALYLAPRVFFPRRPLPTIVRSMDISGARFAGFSNALSNAPPLHAPICPVHFLFPFRATKGFVNL
mmetsp:Transcript_40258/g.90358  ORF Transcript_40258/g.90358 Transcript_40258/m.90358 type:complete len:190 (+) Transcript_40258:174-743(+)